MLRARGWAMFTPLTRAKSRPALSLRGRSRCSMRTAATLSLFPSNRGGFDAPQSFFHASMEFHWIIFARVPISSLRSPAWSHLLFHVDSGFGHIPITLYTRSERRSRAANRFPTGNLLDRDSVSEHAHILDCCEAFCNTSHVPRL